MITIKHLRKEYENVTPLKDVNAEINKGEVISIIGPSGTGKSTFLRCINRLETPTSGEIIIDGENILDKKCKIEKVRQKMGMVFQSFNLFEHKTVIENVMLAPMDILGVDKQTAYDEGMKLLETVSIANRAFQYPSELSGGQKQRVAIARALAMKPEIILFDEPTSALDPTMVGEVLSVIKKLAEEGYTMMIVTHEMQFARDVSTRVFYMDEGIIYDDNTPENIFDNPQKPKTRAFIRKLKSFNREIIGTDFDFVEITNGITEFGKKLWWSKKLTQSANLIFEELVMQSLKNKYGSSLNLEFEMLSNENGDITELCFNYVGESYNAFEGCDSISRALIKNNSTNIEYSFDDCNHLKVTV